MYLLVFVVDIRRAQKLVSADVLGGNVVAFKNFCRVSLAP